MASAVKLREDYSAEALRTLARRSKDVNQSRRLLSLAEVRDGMDRGEAFSFRNAPLSGAAERTNELPPNTCNCRFRTLCAGLIM
jgi:hypothetical protein